MKPSTIFLFVFLNAFTIIRAQEPAWWTQQKKDCNLDPKLAYNTWVAKGEPCNKTNSAVMVVPTNTSTSIEDAEKKAKYDAEQKALAEAEAKKKKEKEEQDEKDKQDLIKRMNGSSTQSFGLTKGPDFDGIKNSQTSSYGLNSTSSTNTANQNTSPNTDPMVVDARNVPNGLPKEVNDAIPLTPAGDRLRKGFQAIQNHDWKVALVWFQDAQNKEPNNTSIKRLVDLAKFTLQYKPNDTKIFENNSTQTISIQDPSIKYPDNEISGIEKKPIDFIARSAATQMAQEGRARASDNEYIKKYGDKNVPAKISVRNKAILGEGYSKEQLEAQFQKALLDYYKWRGNRNPVNDVGGNAVVEEIILGGKG
jgi:hypothetical protein